MCMNMVKPDKHVHQSQDEVSSDSLSQSLSSHLGFGVVLCTSSQWDEVATCNCM